MNKKYIIKKNEEIKNIVNNSNKIVSKYFIIYYVNNQLKFNRYCISVSKKIGKAVTRNYYKRVIRNIVDNHKKLYSKGKDYIIILRKACLEMNYSELEESFLQLINIIEKESENEK